MANPFRSLRYLPWATLFLSAGLTVLVSTAIDVALILAIGSVPAIATALSAAGILLAILPFLVALGVGALAIVLTDSFFRQIILRADTIWALVGCVLLILLVKSWLPIPALFVSLSYFSMMGIAVGAFTKGRRYWR
ncbi:MAG: hypothetical protein WBB01_23065 [Phormidesmis sp.]